MSGENHEGNFKHGIRIIKSTQIGRNLDLFRRHFLDQEKPDWLVIPYILLCAAYPESKLNDSLTEAKDTYGNELSGALLSVSLPTKLKILVPAMTDGEYEINKDHFVYQRLAALIKVRNDLAHAKSEVVELRKDEFIVDGSFIHNNNPKIPPRPIFDEDITLGAQKTFSPTDYHEALDKLDKWFFRRCPDRLTKVEMVVRRARDKEWQTTRSMMVKYLD